MPIILRQSGKTANLSFNSMLPHHLELAVLWAVNLQTEADKGSWLNMKSLLCTQHSVSLVTIHCRLHSCPNLLPHHWAMDKTQFHSDHKLLALNSWLSEVEFYYWKKPTLEFTADKTVGKLWWPTEWQAHTHAFIHTHSSQSLPQAINTCPVTLKLSQNTHHILKRTTPNH